MDLSVFAAGVAGIVVGLLLVAVVFGLWFHSREKCERCGCRNTSRQFLNASHRLFLVCHRCGWEESPVSK